MGSAQLKAGYKRKMQERKPKAPVINAIRTKIIARCFIVIKRDTTFVTSDA
ncbi:hypothetical protein CE91St19_19920 [Odoribacter laneus]|jgi:hypothetical protein|nr:hypothetical protein CE91St19_19920 [Odoribacter laneus]GKI25033.1 hypothetical protein CE91St20_11700 [Odoribacter laneus]